MLNPKLKGSNCFNIPDEQLPSFANDEDGISVLFAPIRCQNVNPLNYNQQIESWKTLLRLYCLNNKVYNFSLDSLKFTFVRHGRPPHCLAEVLQDMVQKGEIVPLDLFLKEIPNSWPKWATDIFIKRPINWSYDKLKKVFFSEDIQQKYVPLDIVRNESHKLFCEFPNFKRNTLLDFNEFLEITNLAANNILNIKILIHNLLKEKKIDTLIIGEQETFLIKFGDINSQPKITEDDVTMFRLERSEKHLICEIEKLEDQIKKYINEAKIYLDKNQKTLATHCLRKKIATEKRLKAQTSTLLNIQSILESIHNTKENKSVLHTYKHALESLKKNQSTQLNIDNVDDTMVELKERFDLQQEIEQIMSNPFENIDESDLEKELADLVDYDINKKMSNLFVEDTPLPKTDFPVEKDEENCLAGIDEGKH